MKLVLLKKANLEMTDFNDKRNHTEKTA